VTDHRLGLSVRDLENVREARDGRYYREVKESTTQGETQMKRLSLNNSK